MSDFLKKNKIELIVGAYVIAMALLFYFFGGHIVGEMAGKANEIQQKKIDGELNDKRLADVPAMEEYYKKFQASENDLAIIIDQNSEVALIKEIEELADQTGNKIEFQIQNAQEVKAVKQKGTENDIKTKLANTNYLSMKIAIEGNYTNLLNFMHKLENYKKTINIISISSEKVDAEEVAGKQANPFALNNPKESNLIKKEVINSVFDVVVYIKK